MPELGEHHHEIEADFGRSNNSEFHERECRSVRFTLLSVAYFFLLAIMNPRPPRTAPRAANMTRPPMGFTNCPR